MFIGELTYHKIGIFNKSVIDLLNTYFINHLWNIDQIATFLANIMHESAGLTVMSENMNYGREGLLKVFPKYFNVKNVDQYVRQPQKIANYVYANRMGNGNVESGDGWKFRGGGPLQLTGRRNYEGFTGWVNSKSISDIDFVKNPEEIRKLPFGVLSAFYYWESNRLAEITISLGFTNVCAIVNLGRKLKKSESPSVINHYQERLGIYTEIKNILL